MTRKEPKDVSHTLAIKISEKYVERIFEKNRSTDYAEGYAEGIKDLMEVLNDYVKSEIEEQKQVDQAKPKEELDTEKLVANFFRRIS